MTFQFVEREIGGRTLRFETGKVARLAHGAVIATYADTAVLATAIRADPRPGMDYFPLQCDYREKLGAGGKFPGGFRKREGPPNEKEILTMRMIDRPIRPLFPDGFIDEVQIQVWVMSHDGQNDTDVLACSAGSAALCLSDAPFEGPVATVRVGRLVTEEGEQFVLNPTHAQMEFSDLDLVLSGHADGVNMIEIGAAEVPDADVARELMEKAGATEKNAGQLTLPADDVAEKVLAVAETEMVQARQVPGKQDRSDAIDALREKVLKEHFALPETGTYPEFKAAEERYDQAREAFRRLEKKVSAKLIAEKGIRADRRALTEIRPLEIEVGVFARTHGSAFFQRGETQSLCVCVLGTTRNEQIVDGLMPEYAKKFYLHYNFPPFATGEAKRIMGPGRREIGHGALAERSLLAILPELEEFPYTIRLISEITESNGSSSMASVCGGCMALMDAGVPIKATVAGISVGRFTAADGTVNHVTDIIGEEDFFGEMDFKVAGTRDGITGVQLDLKARGLWFDEIGVVLEQARKGRLEIIEKMEAVLSGPREELSEYAPRIFTVMIDPEKIGKLIGPGGKTIRGIQERTGATIDVEEDGTVYIGSITAEGGEQAKSEVEALGAEIKVGAVYEGKVVATKDFGAFVEIVPGTDGMCHISELADGYVKSVSDVVKVGDIVKVKVIDVDEGTGKIRLSRRAVMAEESPAEPVKAS